MGHSVGWMIFCGCSIGVLTFTLDIWSVTSNASICIIWMRKRKKRERATWMRRRYQLQIGYLGGHFRRTVGDGTNGLNLLLSDLANPGKGQLLVLFQSVQSEVFRVEVEHGEDQYDRWVDTQLPALPQMRFFQSGRQWCRLFIIQGLKEAIVKGPQQRVQFQLEWHQSTFHEQIFCAIVFSKAQLQTYIQKKKKKKSKNQLENVLKLWIQYHIQSKG